MQHKLFQSKTEHHEITVYETDELDGQKGRFRVLQFASEANQGAIDLNDPERILFEYPRAIIHLMEHNSPSFENAFMIGHGIGTLSRYFSERNILVAELDPVVVKASREYFGYDRDNVCVGDGRSLLANQPSGLLDYILLDAFDAEGTPRHLVSLEFFQITAEKLNPDGMVILNVTGRAGYDPYLNAIAETLKQGFDYIRIFGLRPDREEGQVNFIIVGSRRPILFQARHLAGFSETLLPAGYVIRDKP